MTTETFQFRSTIFFGHVFRWHFSKRKFSFRTLEMSVLRCKANERYQLVYLVQPALFLVLLTRNDKHESVLYFKCATYKIMAKVVWCIVTFRQCVIISRERGYTDYKLKIICTYNLSLGLHASKVQHLCNRNNPS